MNERRAKIALLLGSISLGLLMCECGARAWAEQPQEDIIAPIGIFTIRNFARDRLTLLRSGLPADYDATLGWVPRPGYSRPRSETLKAVTIDDKGLRVNGPSTAAIDPSLGSVLAVGDSFAFGDEVHDEESWPAQLEAITRRRVYNAGVFGYGFDQTVLRAERLQAELSPAVIVVSLIAADVARAGFSMRTGAAKPYFVLENGQLELRNVPVPPERPDIEDIGFFRNVFGYSYLVDSAMRAAGLAEWWYTGNWKSETAHGKAGAVSCALMRRLAELRAAKGVRVIVLMQYKAEDVLGNTKGFQVSMAMVRCAAEAGLEVIDTHPTLRARVQPDLVEIKSLYTGHHTAKGNRLIAELIAQYLTEHP